MSSNTPSPRMSTKVPSAKVQASAIASAITIIVVWSLRQFADVEMPAEVGMALSAVIAALVGYVTPPAARDTIT